MGECGEKMRGVRLFKLVKYVYMITIDTRHDANYNILFSKIKATVSAI